MAWLIKRGRSHPFIALLVNIISTKVGSGCTQQCICLDKRLSENRAGKRNSRNLVLINLHRGVYLESVVVADPLCVLHDLVVREEVEGAVAAEAQYLPARHAEAPRVAR